LNRRAFLKSGALTWAAVRAAADTQVPNLSEKSVRFGVVGLGNRGRHLLRLLMGFPGVQVPAICDLSEKALEAAAEVVIRAGGSPPARYSKAPNDYTAMLRRTDIDAVLIATPTKWHCPQAIAAMNAGKHVGSEVPAGFTLEELWELVRTKERTGRRYILLENYLYMRHNMMVLDMVRQGLFGELYYAECSYIHDCRFMLFKPDGSLDWWGEFARDSYGSDYPTHALGPVSKWFGLNEGDRMEYCTAMMSTPRVLKEYAARKFGPDSPQAKIDFAVGDYTSVLIRTASGKLIRVDYDVNSPRPESHFYLAQGTRGVYDSRKGIHFEGEGEKWTPAETYLTRYDHEYWRTAGAAAEASGHGRGDYFVIRDFVEMVREDREPWIDVYDAASWSSIYHCSRQSIDGRGASVDIPDFTQGKWKDASWRAGQLGPLRASRRA